jgi:Ca2+-binding EF-hand superfamily protein
VRSERAAAGLVECEASTTESAADVARSGSDRKEEEQARRHSARDAAIISLSNGTSVPVPWFLETKDESNARRKEEAKAFGADVVSRFSGFEDYSVLDRLNGASQPKRAIAAVREETSVHVPKKVPLFRGVATFVANGKTQPPRKRNDEEGGKDPAQSKETTVSSTTLRSLWRHRHARSAEEGIRREKTTTTSQLSSILQKVVSGSVLDNSARGHYAARTIQGLINALAEEVDDLNVEVDTKKDTPVWAKHVDAIRIKFSRLGFKPLHISGVGSQGQPPSSAHTSPTKNYGQLARNHEARSSERSGSGEATLLTDVSDADEAFDRIDIDNSGTLDREEMILALNLAANAVSPQDVDYGDNLPMLETLASELFELYDINGDGVVDRKEYKTLVEDMAALRQAQREEEERQEREALEKQSKEGFFSPVRKFVGRWWKSTPVGDSQNVQVVNGNVQTVNGDVKTVNGDRGAVEMATDSSSGRKIVDISQDSATQALGSITFSDLKLDLRRLIFGAVPVLKHITPGGPLVLEPFTATVTGSFVREDIMKSFLLDAALRRLVARVIRKRAGSLRDFVEGALFKGRSWKTFSESGVRVEVPELTNVEFDKKDRMIITGTAMVQTRPNAPVIEQKFKVRTKIGTTNNGRNIRLMEPELALVVECPKVWERNIEILHSAFGFDPPPRPAPLYSFFPIYSPFRIQDDPGFDLGEDNTIKEIYIKDGALCFEMSAVLRPGRFLGSHYVAFTVPMRTFIVTMDRVTEGIRAARRVKRAARDLKEKAVRIDQRNFLPRITLDTAENVLLGRGDIKSDEKTGSSAKPAANSPAPSRRSFFGRFVDGYLQAESNDEKKERLTTAIRDFFGRQGDGAQEGEGR